MRNSTWLRNTLWALLFWGLFFLVMSATPDDIPYCATYEQC